MRNSFYRQLINDDLVSAAVHREEDRCGVRGIGDFQQNSEVGQRGEIEVVVRDQRPDDVHIGRERNLASGSAAELDAASSGGTHIAKHRAIEEIVRNRQRIGVAREMEAGNCRNDVLRPHRGGGACAVGDRMIDAEQIKIRHLHG